MSPVPAETPAAVPTPRKVVGGAGGGGSGAQNQHPPVRPQTSGYRSQPLQTVLAAPVPASPPAVRASAAASGP